MALYQLHLVLLISCLLFYSAVSFSIERNVVKMNLAPPRGSAKVPFQKQNVAILGAGGYLGGCAFGFLQRCGSLYGSGIGRVRTVGATACTLENLNKILSKHFLLAFAGEDLVRLTDMTDVSSITQRLKGYSAVIMGTEYYLEQRPVTGNTYEKLNPNAKTFEFYFDMPRRGMDEQAVNDPDYQQLLFEHTIQACRDSDSVQHVLVIESPRTFQEHGETCARLLDESNVPFTYIKVNGSLENYKDYTFGKGIQGDLQIESFTFEKDYTTKPDYETGSWFKQVTSEVNSNNDIVYREDVAALAVQCLQSLDWSTSRCLVVSSSGTLNNQSFRGRLDKEWCVGANVLADKLAIVQ